MDELLTEIPQKHEEENELEDWTPWRFDPDFHEEISGEYADEGGIALFRIVRKRLGIVVETKYLALFNYHNGYYGHGFTMEIDGTKTQDGCL